MKNNNVDKKKREEDRALTEKTNENTRRILKQ